MNTEVFLKGVYARYLYLFKMDTYNKYSVTLLIPKSNVDLVNKMNTAIQTLVTGASIKRLDNEVMSDGDNRDNPIPGYYLLTCGSRFPIKAIDNKRRILTEDEGNRLFVSGCLVNALIKLQVYENPGNKKGISKYPQCLQYAGVGISNSTVSDASYLNQFEEFELDSESEDSDPY